MMTNMLSYDLHPIIIWALSPIYDVFDHGNQIVSESISSLLIGDRAKLLPYTNFYVEVLTQF